MTRVHLVDATYELFRHYFAVPGELGGVRGVLQTLCQLLREGATHVGCATDRVIRSFRNDLYPGYKTEEGVPADLLAQFPLVEEGIEALGMVLWPMVEFEADDALATAAARFAGDAQMVYVCTPDKDLAQCVTDKVHMLDRRRRIELDAAGVHAKFGVPPAAIPDFLALVGDTADGYPGIPGFGEKTAAAVLGAYGTIEAIPASGWRVAVRGADKLARVLHERRDEALLYKQLATLRRDAPVTQSLADLAWRGARPELAAFCERHGLDDVLPRVPTPARERR
ncbi:MAG TPA: 5'-3' exonuclease H3TH domain-containing protein [Haliangiales bacterium]|nr:5'-3' exonuclease H3TH domain-containing protein [Haliangiales bacterium]